MNLAIKQKSKSFYSLVINKSWLLDLGSQKMLCSEASRLLIDMKVGRFTSHLISQISY